MSQIRKEIKNIKKEIISVLIITFMFAMILGVAKMGLAANNQTVVCTVWGELIAITVTDGAVNYGVVAMDAAKNTTAGGSDNTQTANNTGTVTEDFYIKSSDAVNTVAGTPWTLTTAKGANEYNHTASIDATNFTIVMNPAGNYVALKTGVLTLNTQDFDLQIGMPTGTDDYQEHSITVTVCAVKP